MKKTILAIFMVLVTVVLSSCSSDPIVGDWCPDNDPSGVSIVTFNSDGTVEWTVDAPDGYAYIKGNWSRIEGSSNEYSLSYDGSTIEVRSDNPLIKEVMREGMKVSASQKMEIILNDEGDFFKTKGSTRGFIRY